jgi:hypothetical protein
MKCIKAIRESKGVEVGDIKRVDDKTATNMVGLSWVYIPKSEWKLATRKSKTIESQEGTKSGPSEDQVEKKPYKKGQKSEKHKNKQ